MNRVTTVQEHLNRWMLAYVSLAIVAGLILGNAAALLAAHYGLSLAGVVFEGYFTFLELFVIHAICIWCVAYGVSLLLRFLVTAAVWRRERLLDQAPQP